MGFCGWWYSYRCGLGIGPFGAFRRQNEGGGHRPYHWRCDEHYPRPDFYFCIWNASCRCSGGNHAFQCYFNALLFMVLAKIRKTSVITLSPKHFTLAKKVSFGTLSVGFPAAISVLLVSVSISLLNGLLLSHEGGNILSAAYGVTSKCGTIALHISIGIAQGVMPLIGYGYGAKDHKRVHAVCRLSFLILLVFSVIFLAIVQLIPDAIVRMFIDHAETIAVGSVFMRCWSWCAIGMSLFNMYNSIFQAVGKWKTSLFLAVLRLGVIFTALCFILNAWFGVTGLMWVQAITDTLSCLIAVVLYERFKKSIAAELTQDTQAAKECQTLLTGSLQSAASLAAVAVPSVKRLQLSWAFHAATVI